MLYYHYNDTNEANPRDLMDPGAMSIFRLGDDAVDHCNPRTFGIWVQNGIGRPPSFPHRRSLQGRVHTERYSDSNMNFKLHFQVFLDDYGATIWHNREENKTE